FHQSSTDDSDLFIGYSEILSPFEDVYQAVKFNDIFVYKRVSVKNRSSEEQVAVKDIDMSDTKSIDVSSFKIKEKKEAIELYKEALELMIKEKFDESMKKVEITLELDSSNSQAYLLYGRLNFEKGLYSEAQVAVERAIDLDSDSFKAHYLLGAVFEKQGLYQPAVLEYKKALSINNDFAMGHFNLANLISRDNKKQALKEYKKAVEICLNHPAEKYLDFIGGFSSQLLLDLCERKIKTLKKDL
ncbi:tetratricopeptide repeat protein, partial [Elusimicrobiota bacterium]